MCLRIDLWSYRGITPVNQPTPMGHEYCGIVEEVGSAIRTVKPGQFVIGSFFASDNTCPNCNFGYPSSCQQREFVGGAQSPLLRVPLADGTLVSTPGVPAKEMIPNLLATSDVLGTGWFAADAANVQACMTVAAVRRFHATFIDSVWKEKTQPGKVFDLPLRLDQVAEGYSAMDERRAITAILQPYPELSDVDTSREVDRPINSARRDVLKAGAA